MVKTMGWYDEDDDLKMVTSNGPGVCDVHIIASRKEDARISLCVTLWDIYYCYISPRMTRRQIHTSGSDT